MRFEGNNITIQTFPSFVILLHFHLATLHLLVICLKWVKTLYHAELNSNTATNRSQKSTSPQDKHHQHQQKSVCDKGLIGDHWTFIGSYHLIEQAIMEQEEADRCGRLWQTAVQKMACECSTNHR